MVTVVVKLHGHHQRHDVLHQDTVVVKALEVLYSGHDVLNCSNLSPLLLGNNAFSKFKSVSSLVCNAGVKS
jgi:hypothetical protein